MNDSNESRQRLNVFVVGSGKLADEILAALHGDHIKSVRRWSDIPSRSEENTVVVHAGSGRELNAVHAYCSENTTPMLELATTTNHGSFEPSFPLVLCPNTNILVLKFMAMVQRAGGGFEDYDRTILESHQSSKTSEAGTARSLARSLGIKIDTIESVRDRVRQEALGIPRVHLGRHAFHRIQIKDDSATITLESAVLGPAPYAPGLAEILRIVMAKRLEMRVYDILEFF